MSPSTGADPALAAAVQVVLRVFGEHVQLIADGTTATADTATVGTCGKCRQPNIPIVGVDGRGRPACADCTNEGGQ